MKNKKKKEIKGFTIYKFDSYVPALESEADARKEEE